MKTSEIEQYKLDAQYWNGCAIATYAVFGAGFIFQSFNGQLDLYNDWLLLIGFPLIWVFRWRSGKAAKNLDGQ
ncbi:MAG: hypothetical protein HKN63_07610 [Rhodobacteraceae bacterium]|nr:hypothetical protein [Paracoccaceae bacterium]